MTRGRKDWNGLAYFLAVDAGGTKTEFLLADEHRELGRVRSGSIKRLRRDAEATTQNLSCALKELTTQSGVSLLSVTRCCIGASGVTVPMVSDWITEAFRPQVGGELLLVEDVDIALDAAFQGKRGVLILAGTGSNVAGRGLDGHIVTAGGWGPTLSDEGSGFFLGVDALRKGFRAIDEQRPTMLLDAIQKFWNLNSLGELVEFANANPAPEFSELAPLVIACAMQGDRIAIETVQHGGKELAALASIVLERIRVTEEAAGETFLLPPIALAGSIVEKVPWTRHALEEALRLRYPGVESFAAAVNPVEGALWRARRGN
jgi:glucosamine kinase